VLQPDLQRKRDKVSIEPNTVMASEKQTQTSLPAS
jgi:hypothetical protein